MITRFTAPKNDLKAWANSLVQELNRFAIQLENQRQRDELERLDLPSAEEIVEQLDELVALQQEVEQLDELVEFPVEVEQSVDDSASLALMAQASNLEQALSDLTELNESLPIGIIVMWSGTTIPKGWGLCDGTNGTPDLQDKFIIGSGLTYATGATGGSAIGSSTETTTAEASSPTLTTTALQEGTGASTNVVTGFTLGTHTHDVDVEVDTIPPFYALAFIMRIS